MRSFIFLFVLLISADLACSQVPRSTAPAIDSIAYETPSLSKNLLYLEMFGNAGYFSVNYEHVVSKHFSFRLGFGGHQFDIDQTAEFPASKPVFIALINWVTVRYFSYFEIGIGADFQFDSKLQGKEAMFHNSSYILPTGRIGMALAPEGGGVCFVLAITPFFNFKPLAMFTWFSIGVGLSFD